MRNFLAVFLFVLLAACGGGGGGGSGADVQPPPAQGLADITLLFMGNSHTAVNDLPAMVAAMVRAARPGRTVFAQEAPGWMFLEEPMGGTRLIGSTVIFVGILIIALFA